MDYHDMVGRLYARPREEFIRARTALAQELDGDEAKQARSIPKPTVAVWLANAVGREEHELVETAVELAEKLRTAHRKRDGAALRELTRARGALSSQVVKAAAQHGQVSATTAEQLRALIPAVLADDDTAARWARGALLDIPEPSDDWSFLPTPLVAVAEQPPRQTKQQREDEQRRQRERDQAAEELTEAQETLRSKEKRLKSLRKKITVAEQEHRQAREAVRFAERKLRAYDQ